MRILVFGAGVIGSVYAGKLLQADHDVVLYARGRRLDDLRAHGLILEDAGSHARVTLRVHCVDAITVDDHYDLVLVPVRAEQLESTLPAVTAMTDGSDVLFFGNTAGHTEQLRAAIGDRGFPTAISAHIDDWLTGHASFIVPVAFALYRVGIDPAALAADPFTLRLMVRATRQCFTALRAAGNTEIPSNLRALYRLPPSLVAAYWRRVFAGPHGELWFAAHTRAAPEEMSSLARQLQVALRRTGHHAPDLETLLTIST